MVWEWLTASLDATRGHEVDMGHAWHGRFMVLAWGICAPLGVLIARYLKVTPNQRWPEELDNRFWWRSHLWLQSAATIFLGIGLAIAVFNRGEGAPGHLHAWFGWIVVWGTVFQVIGGLLRGTKGGPSDPRPDGSLHGDHYGMTRRRRIFEHLHKALGYLLLMVSNLVVLQGLWMLNAPKWMPLLLVAFWAILFLVVRQLRSRPLVSTYQAIWGLDPIHPGNHASGKTLD